jgi:hypothetical protein
MKHLMLHCLASSLHGFIASLLSTLCEFMQKLPYNSAEHSDTFVKAKTTKCFGFATEITEI